MAKSPINILQEHCVKQHFSYPNYTFRDGSTAGTPQFFCDCLVNGITTTGIASSKIVAKTKAADFMLQKLNIVSGPKEIPTKQAHPAILTSSNGNYVGILNEYCSQKGMPYPVYQDTGVALNFIVTCTLNNLSTDGKGTNKKSAKQLSAKAMVELIHQRNGTPNSIDDGIKSMSLSNSTNSNYSYVSSIPSTTLSHCNLKVEMPQCKTDEFTFNNLDNVSAMNVYCDKYRYEKPEYFEMGKEGDLFRKKCQFRKNSVTGTGLTMKFAKQDSARKMMELIGIKPEVKVENLIDIDGTSIVDGIANATLKDEPKSPIFAPQSVCPSTQRSNNEVISLYKKHTQPHTPTKPLNNSITNATPILPFSGEDSAKNKLQMYHPLLHKQLQDHDVKYDLTILQKQPYIICFSGNRTTNDETVSKNFLEVSGDIESATKKILLTAIESFKI